MSYKLSVKQEHQRIWREARDILELAQSENRGLTDAEQAKYERKSQTLDEMGDRLLKLEEDEERDADITRGLDRILERPVADGMTNRLEANSWAGKATRSITELRAGRGASETRAFNSGSIDAASPLGRLHGIPHAPTTVADLFPVVTVEESFGAQPVNSVSYLRQTVRTNNADFVADGGTKPSSVHTVVEIEDRLRVLAHLSEAIPIRYLDDSAQLVRFLEDEMRYGLMNKLDDAIMNGDDADAGSEVFNGLLTLAATPTAFDTDVLTTASKVLTAQLSAGETPTGWVFNPSDWSAFALAREATDGGYLHGRPASLEQRSLLGLPVHLAPAMTSGTAMLVDNTKAAIHTKAATRVDWDGGGDLFEKNQTRVRVEGRFALAVYRPSSFVAFETEDAA